ncbi:transcriptional regulator, Rrf2 family [Bifidobacterium gallicum DSM 20093 = LMG 11596]|nr:transcriptional regulator, Rrf2 family [Bifidobacterium gallicum DSM 20093 = LMG 11596]
MNAAVQTIALTIGGMQISSRFTMAVHVMVAIDVYSSDHKVTSTFLAKSVNANPVIIRRLIQQLKNDDLITVTRGAGGAVLARDPQDITLLDIFDAVEAVDDAGLFNFHDNPGRSEPVGRHIHDVLDVRLDRVHAAMERELQSMTVADLAQHMRTFM